MSAAGVRESAGSFLSWFFSPAVGATIGTWALVILSGAMIARAAYAVHCRVQESRAPTPPARPRTEGEPTRD